MECALFRLYLNLALQEGKQNMVYCMSDVHGEYYRYLAMLEQIRFSDEDTLYVLGDVIDRRPYGIAILQDIMQRPNIRMILGNHEKMMLDAFWSVNPFDARRLWKSNGGGSTFRKMVYGIPIEERLRILRFVQELPDHLDVEVNNQQFHLVHGLPADNTYDRIWSRPEPPPKEPLIPGKTVIIGHTCTYWMDLIEDRPFQIWHGPGLIDIDCGCGNLTKLRRLACLRLDDMQEFYI